MATRFILAASIVIAASSVAVPAAFAQEPAIGVAAPTSGPAALLGAQVLAGAREAMGATTLVEADTACTAAGGREAAARFVAAKVRIVTGFLCTPALEAALPVLTAADIPIITSGVRAARLTDRRGKTGALLWRVAPRSDAQAEALAKTVSTRWRDMPFGLVDDGTVDGRGLADALRSRLEAAGVKPILIDTYRPADEKQFGLVRRILASGVTHIVIAGDRPDVAIIARDAAASGLTLEIVGGEQLFDEPGPVPLPAGLLAVAPVWQFSSGSAGEPPEEREGYFGPSLAATEIAAEAVAEAGRSGRSLPDILGTTRFSTRLGIVTFDAKGDSGLGLFRTFRFDGTSFGLEVGG
jgi:branched-chain amino acid transport system substrate-binding protein